MRRKTLRFYDEIILYASTSLNQWYNATQHVLRTHYETIDFLFSSHINTEFISGAILTEKFLL